MKMFSSSHRGFNLISYLGRNNRSLMTAAPSASYSWHSDKTIPINNIRLFVIKANYLLMLFTDSDRLLLIKKIPRTLSKPYLRVVALLSRSTWHWLRCVCHFRIEARKKNHAHCYTLRTGQQDWTDDLLQVNSRQYTCVFLFSLTIIDLECVYLFYHSECFKGSGLHDAGFVGMIHLLTFINRNSKRKRSITSWKRCELLCQ